MRKLMIIAVAVMASLAVHAVVIRSTNKLSAANAEKRDGNERDISQSTHPAKKYTEWAAGSRAHEVLREATEYYGTPEWAIEVKRHPEWSGMTLFWPEEPKPERLFIGREHANAATTITGPDTAEFVVAFHDEEYMAYGNPYIPKNARFLRSIIKLRKFMGEWRVDGVVPAN